MTVEGALLRAEDFLEKQVSEGRAELIDGVVVEMTPPGGPHASTDAAFISALHQYASTHGGRALAEVNVIVAKDPGTIRIPDAAFLAANRAAEALASALESAPEVVVEVVSPNDKATELQAKVATWLRAGARLVWVAYPETRTIAVYEPAGRFSLLTEGDLLTGGDVLPGFSVAVRAIFA